MIIFFLLLWMAIILAFNYWDYKVTKDGGKPEYFLYYLVRGIASISHSTLFLIFMEPEVTNYGDLSAWRLLMIWMPFVIFHVTSFWLIYEIVRNIWTGEAWLYYDHQEGDSGYIDRFFKWAGVGFHAAAKVLCLVVMVLSIIVLYSRY